MDNQNLREQLLQATAEEKAQLLFDYMKNHGQEHYEEDVTQMAHALQAAHLAREGGFSDELITAALLHDIGHMLADDPNEANNPTIKNDLHEELAADYLQAVFPAAVTEPIRLHVPAKRYLCTTNPEYYDGLSEASRKSFHLQGGRMSDEERSAFESNPFHKEAVQLRIWDDQAKDLGKAVPEIEAYGEIVRRVLN